MNEQIASLLIGAGFGILGGIIRFAIISLKMISVRKKIFFQGFFMQAVVLIFIGAFSGILLNYGQVLSFLAGYAGLDLMDGYYKAFSKKKIKMKVNS